jgi:hypothetical protein
VTRVAFDFPIEPGRVFSFARSVGDEDPVYRDQIFGPAAGDPLVTPPTFVRSAEHYQPAGAPAVPADQASTVHAEQHFEYLAPFRMGDRVTVDTRPGEIWRKQGRSGALEFFETLTEYRDSSGAVLVRARKVSVRLLDGPTT